MKAADKDPRIKNHYPRAETLSKYTAAYAKLVAEGLSKVSEQALEQVFELLEKTIASGRRVYVAGNGGSAAIADHLCCDWMKGTHVAGKPALRVHPMTSSPALFTALANDFSYEDSISRQVEMLGDAGDVLVLISSSGNSPNIVKAAEVGKTRKLRVVGLTGFDGGRLRELADVSLHVPVENYGMAEDAHQMLMHVLTQCLARKRDGARQ